TNLGREIHQSFEIIFAVNAAEETFAFRPSRRSDLLDKFAKVLNALNLAVGIEDIFQLLSRHLAQGGRNGIIVLAGSIDFGVKIDEYLVTLPHRQFSGDKLDLEFSSAIPGFAERADGIDLGHRKLLLVRHRHARKLEPEDLRDIDAVEIPVACFPFYDSGALLDLRRMRILGGERARF